MCPLSGRPKIASKGNKWSTGDRQLFPSTVVSPALKRTGGYPLLSVGKATFRNRPRKLVWKPRGFSAYHCKGKQSSKLVLESAALTRKSRQNAILDWLFKQPNGLGQETKAKREGHKVRQHGGRTFRQSPTRRCTRKSGCALRISAACEWRSWMTFMRPRQLPTRYPFPRHARDCPAFHPSDDPPAPTGAPCRCRTSRTSSRFCLPTILFLQFAQPLCAGRNHLDQTYKHFASKAFLPDLPGNIRAVADDGLRQGKDAPPDIRRR